MSPDENFHSRRCRNNDSYPSDTLALSFNPMYLTGDDRRPQKEPMAEFTEILNEGHVEMIGKQPMFLARKEGC